MESAGTTPRVGIGLDDLGELLERPGPFLTLYLTTEPDVENAAIRSEQRWKGLRREVSGWGAPDDVLDLVDPLVADAHLEGRTLVVVADESEVLLAEHLEESVEEDLGAWGRLPRLLPLLRSRQSHPPYLVVLADHGGADLIAERPRRGNLERSVGDDDPMRKVSPGGWSQPRYQQRADNDWASTAADVAEQVARVADATEARIIVLGGDVRATNMIRDDLPAEHLERTHLIAQGRAADGSEAARAEEIQRLVATAVAEDTVALLRKFEEERGQLDRAVDGIAATVDALNRAAVDVLLVRDVPDRVASVGSRPIPLALDDAAAVTDEPLDRAPLSDALVRAAAGTGASVRVIPDAGPVREGVGALLRWSTRAS